MVAASGADVIVAIGGNRSGLGLVDSKYFNNEISVE
jgi:hypothetical protein